MTRVFITGIAGFTGIHLARHLLAQGEQVFGFDRTSDKLPPEFVGSVPVYAGDIRDQNLLEQILKEVQPEIVYHLAGILKSAHVEDFYQINVLGTVILFEAIVGIGYKPMVLVTSSSAVYGSGTGLRSVTERSKPRPWTHYGVSKVAQEAVAHRYRFAYSLPVFCTRAFNLIGPGQSSELACSDFARQIALLERESISNKISVGNINARRDFVDVRDAVRAYELVARYGEPGAIYNVCSQKAVSIKRCLDILLALARVPLEIVIDVARLQSNDVPVMVGSAARLVNRTGWRPEIPLQQSLADLLDYWREQATVSITH